MARRLYERHWLLWDGECGLCRRVAEWVEREDRQRRFFVLPYQDAPSPPMTPVLAEACARAVHVVRADGAVLRGGRASLFVLDRLGWHNAARVLSLPPLGLAVEAGYRLVAANRPLLTRLFRI